MRESPRELAMIVAVARNGVIGKDNALPWRLPEDMVHFRKTTTGHAVIMGRKTHESIGGPLRNRRNIVVTRNPSARFEGCEVAHSLEEALARVEHDPLPFVIGGDALYRLAFPLATQLYVTRIDREVEGDAFFPTIDEGQWTEVERREGETPGVVFTRLERRRG